MVTFASLILGLTLGVHSVALTVEGPVAAVEVLLDGASVVRLEHKPWVARVDFGTELKPHELVARAMNSKGEEIAKTSQLINLPRPPAETRVVIEHDDRGKAVAVRLVWATLTNVKPKKIVVTFDGLAVPASEDRIALPSYDPAAPHVLTAEVEFSPALRCRSDIVIGGGGAQESTSELTGVAVELEAGQRLAGIGSLEGLFIEEGKPLRVMAVEEGPTELLIVRDAGTAETARKLAANSRKSRRPGGLSRDAADAMGNNPPPQPAGDIPREEARLAREDRARFIWPVSQHFEGAEISSDLFARSHDFDFGSGLYSLLTRVSHPVGTTARQRLTDAVAVAGLEAVGASRRRGVLLVLGSEVSDSSLLAPANVRGFLEALHVPLFVWSLGDPVGSGIEARWGRTDDVSSEAGFEKAFERLKKRLSSQRIVWLEGRHLPQAISLSPRASEIQLAR